MLLGIDLGTTALKVAAFDPEGGTLLFGVERRLAIAVDESGKREQSPKGVALALRQALRDVGNALGGLERVRGLALAAQGGSTIIADRASGKACTPMILWNDGRAFPQFDGLAARKSAEFWYSRTQREEPGMGLARIAWLRASQPEVLTEAHCYVGAGEFIFHHLTGAWRQDPCNALQIGVYDSRHRALSAELAALADQRTDFFAPLRNDDEMLSVSAAGAKFFGLPAGIPVAGPYMDHEAGYLSVAHVSERPLQCSLGTAWVGNFSLPDGVVGTSPFQLAIPAPHASGQLVIQPLLTGNVTWDWGLSTFVDAQGQRALKKQERIFESAVLPPEGLVALPWLNRPNGLCPERLGNACLLGMGPTTSRDDLIRAVATGMACELGRVFAPVQAAGVIDSVILSGGASQGRHFQQLVSGLFDGVPVFQIDDAAWMGTRGALHAFGTRISQATVRPVDAGSLDMAALRRHTIQYQEAFNRLYGPITAGRAYAVETPE